MRFQPKTCFVFCALLAVSASSIASVLPTLAVVQAQTRCSNPACPVPGGQVLGDLKFCDRCGVKTEFGEYSEQLDSAKAKVAARQYRDAAATFISAATKRVSNVRKSAALGQAGMAFLEIPDIESADKELEKAARLDPENKEALLGYGRVALAKSQFDQADARFMEANRIAQQEKYAALYLGQSKYKQQKFSEARKYFLMIEADNLRDYDLSLMLGNCLLSLSQDSEAESRLLRAHSISSTEIEPIVKLAELYSRLNRNKDSAGMWAKAASLKPNDASFRVNEGIAYFAAEEYDLAEKAFLVGLSRESNNVEALQMMGYIQLQVKKDPKAAKVYFDRVLTLKPENLVVEMLVARCIDLIETKPVVILAAGKGASRQLAWHPGGKKFAFQSNRDKDKNIYISSIGGAEAKITTTGSNGGACWFPDGNRIAYHSVRNKVSGIYAYDLRTKKETAIISDAFQNESPSFAPKGRFMVFQRRKDDKAKWDLFILNIDTGKAKQLTNHAANDESPRWSPDGRSIAFLSDRSGVSKLYVMKIDPIAFSDFRVQTEPPSTRLTATINDPEGPATWNPESSRIAFSIQRSKSWQLYFIVVGGTVVRKLGDIVKGDEMEPAWSPTGIRIASTVYTESKEVTGRDSYGNPIFGPTKRMYQIRSIPARG